MGMTMTPEKAIDTITHFCEYITPCDEYGYRIDGQLCEAHLMAVRALTIQKWIPVTERLPDENQVVLCMRRNKSYWVAQWTYIDWMWYDENEWHNENEVTHWMPLPEPPKEDDGNG